MEAIRAEMYLFCVSMSWVANTHLRIFLFLTSVMALWVMVWSLPQVGCLIRISLVEPDGVCFLTALVTWVKNLGNDSAA